MAVTSQQLLLQTRLRVSRISRHICSHGGHVAKECVDHAAALGALGHVSSHTVNARWPPPRFDTSNLVRGCNDFLEVQHRLCDARAEHTPPQQARALL